jgi:hypothetical protein
MVASVNFDIQGANLLPSLNRTTFAVGAETGGARLRSMVADAVGSGPLDTRQFSSIFGENRSDYVNFTNVGIPTVFFGDSTGPCYHTAQDEIGVVDFWKLGYQVRAATRLVDDLVTSADPPHFVSGTPLATFDDALALQHVITTSIDDIGRFTEAQQQRLRDFIATVNRIVADGAGEFGSDDVSSMLSGAAAALNILSTGVCDGFLVHH